MWWGTIGRVLTVMSWNMNQREPGWDRLGRLVSSNVVSVALLQEARRPEQSLTAGWNLHPPADEIDQWRIAVPRHFRTADGSLREARRRFASAVLGRDGLPVVPLEPTELHQAAEGPSPPATSVSSPWPTSRSTGGGA